MHGVSLSPKLREPLNGLIHLISAVLACAGLVLLLTAANGNTLKLISVLIYGISLILLFSASATYHLVIASDKIMGRLRKFDHAAIYLLIAGTYTPYVPEFVRWCLALGVSCLHLGFCTGWDHR